MDIFDYDKIELIFEEYGIMLPKSIIEKFQVDKVETLIEAKYDPEDEYNVYIAINRILAEKFWKEEGLEKETSCHTLTECIQMNSIYDIRIYQDNNLIKKYSPIWSYTEFNNEHQRIGITDDKILIRIKEI